MSESLPLVFNAPRRGQPPRHWADLTPAQRREYVEAAGHRAFRARQLSAHYFEGFRTDPAEWTDLPVSIREPLAERFLPSLLTPFASWLATGTPRSRAFGGCTMALSWRASSCAIPTG
jgi:hypothetical protein